MLPTTITEYLLDGCGRCEFHATDRCKARSWNPVLVALREVVLTAGLEETIKWGVPCYMVAGRNLMLLSALKDSVTLSFFKGALMQDNDGQLISPGANSQAACYLKFTTVEEVQARATDTLGFIEQAKALELSGQKVEFSKEPEPMPDELEEALAQDSLLNHAFQNLTKGKQRGYILYISQAKQAASRRSRIEKCRPKIMGGEGLHDKYGKG